MMTNSQKSSLKTAQLPLKTYFSLWSYLTPLLLSSFIILPRSKFYITSSDPTTSTPRTSADRPEHPFLTPLTTNVIVTMSWDILGLWICVMWWGQHLRGWFSGGGGRGKEMMSGEEEVVMRQERMKVILNRLKESAMATMGSAFAFTPILILFGAPLDEYLLHTFLLAVHLSLLLVWPVIHALGIPSLYESGIYDRYRLTKLVCEFRADTPLERAVVYPIIGTLIGAWLGALPIPLDWDRPWQSYPLTPAFSSIVGFIIGGYASWAQSAFDVLKQDVKDDYAASAASTPNSLTSKKKNKTKKIA